LDQDQFHFITSEEMRQIFGSTREVSPSDIVPIQGPNGFGAGLFNVVELRGVLDLIDEMTPVQWKWALAPTAIFLRLEFAQSTSNALGFGLSFSLNQHQRCPLFNPLLQAWFMTAAPPPNGGIRGLRADTPILPGRPVPLEIIALLVMLGLP